MNQQQFNSKFADFCDQSMRWCAKQAEASVEQTSTILNILLSDATRVSKMSKDTLEALDKFKVQLGRGTETTDSKATTIVGALKALTSQNLEFGEFAGPIIETLQFQDRIRQNMENLAKMINIWIFEREYSAGNTGSEEILKAFGEKLNKATTMKSERDVVRKYIPGLPPEVQNDDVLLF